MKNDKVQFPILKWAQRKDRLFITINVVHTQKPIVEIIEGKKLKYSGTDGATNYAFEIEFYDEVVKDESKYNLDARTIFLIIKKKTEGPHWPRLLKENLKYQWIQVDWAYYADEDEEEEAKKPNFDGQDFGDLEMDEDDEKPEEKKEDEKKEEEQKEEKKADLSDLDKEEK